MSSTAPSQRPPVHRALLRLALPVVAVNVGLMLMGVVDTLAVGRVSASALAAVAVANVYYFALSMFGFGVLMALDPVISQAIGARQPEAAARAVQRGILLACLLSIPLMSALTMTGPVLRLFRQPAEIIPLAHQYALLLIAGFPAVLLFSVGRQYLQANHHLTAVLWTMLAANLLNAGLNYTLIFGHFGLPAMGVSGAAIATSTSRILMVVALLLFAWRDLRPVLRPWRAESWQPKPLGALLRLGLPIAGHVELEMGAFAGVALLMGSFGTVAVAGHQIAINIASFTFMVPMGIGMAASVMVGHAVGRGDATAAREIAKHTLMVSGGFMACTGVLLVLFPREIAALYSTDVPVRAMAASLLPIAGLFQVFDGLQVSAVGVLRGMGDTRAPMLINLVGFGVCGFGTSLFLAYRTGLGAPGLWWGLVIGLVVVSTVLVLRVRVMVARPILRVVVE